MSLLHDPALNKGSAFSHQERKVNDIESFLPFAVDALQVQKERANRQYKSCQTDLAKNAFLISLREQNLVLFYSFLRENLAEMLPIIYTPTEGNAIKNYSTMFRRPEGCYLTFPVVKEVREFKRLLQSQVKDKDKVDLIVVSDGEQILGIGDQGVGAIGISTAKLTLYTALAGINPAHTLAVCLDVGTNNESLLKDELYLGWRHERVRGKDYYAFIDNFVKATFDLFPQSLLHFEDFGLNNARQILDMYNEDYAIFNDDIQGTGAVTVACIKSALKATDTNLADARILIYGAGTAGMGICEQLTDAIRLESGQSTNLDVSKQFWLVDKEGLLFDDMTEREPSSAFEKKQLHYARNSNERSSYRGTSTLIDVVREAKPTILIGTSTQAGAFNEKVISEMALHCSHPIILPLSNPTNLHECHPADALKWSKGKGLIATGSPFDPIEFQGTKIVFSECNNALIYPGVGLGCIVSRARKLTKTMISAASDVLADQLSKEERNQGMLLPDFGRIEQISNDIATAVALKAAQEGLSCQDSFTKKQWCSAVLKYQWKPEYPTEL